MALSELKNELKKTLRRKLASIGVIIAGACVLAAVMFVLYRAALWLMPAPVAEAWKGALARLFEDPDAVRTWLIGQGRKAPWFFIGAQVLQVIFAPIPGQVVAMAGGYVFGFWKGWALSSLGLVLGSQCAMALGRLLGRRFVRRFVPSSVMERFDGLIDGGGYMTFFMIFLLPALPDDAVCFIAGLTRLKLMPLSAVCLLGRAPGMAVLSLLGGQLQDGLTLSAKILFVLMMLASVVIWIFSEKIEEYARTLWRKK